MKDIDFDELDRAVTSLLGKPSGSNAMQPPKAPAAPQPEPEHQRAPQQPQPQATPSVTVPQPKPERLSNETAKAQTPSLKSRPNTERPAPQTQVAKPAVTTLQKPVSQPSVVAKPEELGANNTKFPITPATPSRTAKSAAAPTRGATGDGQQNQGMQNRRPSGRFMDFVQPNATGGNGNSRQVAKPSTPALKSSTPNSANTTDGVKKPEPTEKTPIAPPKQTPSSETRPQNPLMNRPSRASHVGKSLMPPEESSRSLDNLVPRKPRTENTAQPTEEKSAKPSFVNSFLGKKDNSLLEEKAASHPETSSLRKQTEDIPSPFVTGAKVEKRPLGSAVKQAAPSSQRPQPEEKPVSESSSAPKEESDGQLAPKPTSLPPELGQDIVAVEARDSHATNRPDTPLAYPPEETKSPQSQKVMTARSASQAAHTATLSIPQQYRAKQASPDKTPRSIYDTEEYHTPLPTAAVKKKKSHPIVWILIVILLLAVGAGLGVAVYFLFG